MRASQFISSPILALALLAGIDIAQKDTTTVSYSPPNSHNTAALLSSSTTYQLHRALGLQQTIPKNNATAAAAGPDPNEEEDRTTVYETILETLTKAIKYMDPSNNDESNTDPAEEPVTADELLANLNQALVKLTGEEKRELFELIVEAINNGVIEGFDNDDDRNELIERIEYLKSRVNEDGNLILGLFEALELGTFSLTVDDDIKTTILYVLRTGVEDIERDYRYAQLEEEFQPPDQEPTNRQQDPSPPQEHHHLLASNNKTAA